MNILEKIIAEKKVEIARQKQAVSMGQLGQLMENKAERTSVSFRDALLRSNSGIIAEFKRKSPSKGWIFEDAKIENVIPAYTSGGATACSILTDEPFFGGNLSDLLNARTLTGIPILRKDFIIDEYQIFQAKLYEADVILLIASALSKAQAKQLAATARTLGMEILLEIHSEAELDYISPEMDVIGINNRNLSSFETDINLSFELGAKIPDDYVKISESGITQPETVKSLRTAGFRGFLMGENFMKTDHPGETLKAFVEEVVK